MVVGFIMDRVGSLGRAKGLPGYFGFARVQSDGPSGRRVYSG